MNRGFVGSIIVMLVVIDVELYNFNDRTLGINSVQGADTIFGTVFVIMWGGAAVITLIMFKIFKG